MKKILTLIFFLLFFLLIPPVFYFLESQPVNLTQEKIEYNLPYPGILPDHPLYFFKKTRDKLLELTTRDSMKKAELYLLFSDKKIAMAMNLAKNGKDKTAVTSLAEAEQYFSQIPDLVKTSEKQGVSPTSDFLERLKLSNSKHKEVGNSLLRDLPQNFSSEINKSLDLNRKLKLELEKL